MVSIYQCEIPGMPATEREHFSQSAIKEDTLYQSPQKLVMFWGMLNERVIYVLHAM